MLFRVVQAIFGKRHSNEIKNTTMLMGSAAFQQVISAVLGLVLILIGGNGFRATPLTYLIAAFSGFTIFLSTFCGVYAMKSGTVSLNSMFGTAGMLIPVLAGAFLFNQPITPMQIVGLGVFFVAAYLLVGASKTVYSNFNYKTLLLLIGSMVANGCTMLSQQMFTTYVPEGDVTVFSFLSFSIIAVLSGSLYLFTARAQKEKTDTKLSKPLIVCGVALAVSVFFISQLATLSTALTSPVILFTFINGGGTIISTLVAAVVYKERIKWKTVLGILLGVASLILIKAFAYR